MRIIPACAAKFRSTEAGSKQRELSKLYIRKILGEDDANEKMNHHRERGQRISPTKPGQFHRPRELLGV